jgi:alginate biosynthesis protein AlgX
MKTMRMRGMPNCARCALRNLFQQQGLLVQKFNQSGPGRPAEGVKAFKARYCVPSCNCFTQMSKQESVRVDGVAFAAGRDRTQLGSSGFGYALQCLFGHDATPDAHNTRSIGLKMSIRRPMLHRYRMISLKFGEWFNFSQLVCHLGWRFNQLAGVALKPLRAFVSGLAVVGSVAAYCVEASASPAAQPPASMPASPEVRPLDAIDTACPASIIRSGTEYIQGSNGVFFRLFPDLDMYFPLDAQVATEVAKIAALLKAKGTELVMLPVPARGTVMGRHLANVPVETTYAFDPAIAAKSYTAYVNTLESVGVTTLDLMAVLMSRNDGTDFFLPSDHHWNPSGAKAAAEALGKLLASRGIGSDLSGGEFRTASVGTRILPSTMRREIQVSCSQALPPNAIAVTETVQAAAIASAGTPDLFGDSSQTIPVVLTGTSFSDVDEFNFAGMISQSTGLEVANFAISGGNQFASILSYVTSPDFEQNRPRILLWENPVYNNLGAEGEAPLIELMVAASGACSPDAADALQGVGAAGKFEADIPPKWRQTPDNVYVRVDVGDTSERTVEFETVSDNGDLATQTITRASRFKTNGVFFAKLSGGDIKHLTIKSPRFNPEKSAITLCQINERKP